MIYRDRDDLQKKVAYYSSHDDARRAIGQAGMRRVVEKHTYRNRLQSAQASIIRFHRESRALTKLDEFISSDPAKATRFARFLTQEGIIEADKEHLSLLEAKAHLALGD